MKRSFHLFIPYLLSLFLLGCGGSASSSLIQMPPHVLLRSEMGQVIGQAIPLRQQVFITADQNQPLFWRSSKPLDIVARDFDRNLVFLKASAWRGPVVSLASSPPVVGESYWWFDGSDQQFEVEMTALANHLGTEDIFEEKDFLVFRPVGEKYIPPSGAPVFSEEGIVQGIVVGANETQEVFYALRSDRLQDLYQLHRGED